MTLARAHKIRRRSPAKRREDRLVERTAYAADAYTWAIEQSELLRAGQLDAIDADNIADEITDVAHYLADKLRSDLLRVLQHLIKWDYQSEKRSRSWALSVREHRRRVATHLRKAPGLRSVLSEIVAEAYADARDEALMETDLSEGAIPTECPYDWDDIISRPIAWPA